MKNQKTTEKTYDVYFSDQQYSNNKGFEYTMEEAIKYIQSNNGTNESYLQDYRGGTASVVCNQDGEVVYEQEIKL